MMKNRRPKPKWARFAGYIGLGFALLSGIAMLVMMIVGVTDIIGTNIFRKPLPATFEITSTFMVIVVFFAMSLAQARKAHIRVEILYQRFPGSIQKLADLFQYAVCLTFFTLVTYFAWISAFRSFSVGEFSSGIINFPIWPARFSLALGATLMSIQCLIDLLGEVFGWEIDDSADTSVGDLK